MNDKNKYNEWQETYKNNLLTLNLFLFYFILCLNLSGI